MTERYEAAYSGGPEPMILIFAEGKFEALPFEVRLMEPWYGCRYVEAKLLKPNQRYEIMRLGYTLLREGESKVRRAA